MVVKIGLEELEETELRILVVEILQTLGETKNINDEVIDSVKRRFVHLKGLNVYREHMRNDVEGYAGIILNETLEKVKTIREKSANLSWKSSLFKKSNSEAIRAQAVKLRKKADELNKLGSNIVAIAQKIIEEEAKMEADELLQSADMELFGTNSMPANRKPVPPEWKDSLYEQQKGLCFGCKRRFEVRNLSVDHIKPVQLGGETELGNLQLLCQSCNSTKGTGTQEELISKLTKSGIL